MVVLLVVAGRGAPCRRLVVGMACQVEHQKLEVLALLACAGLVQLRWEVAGVP